MEYTEQLQLLIPQYSLHWKTSDKKYAYLDLLELYSPSASNKIYDSKVKLLIMQNHRKKIFCTA